MPRNRRENQGEHESRRAGGTGHNPSEKEEDEKPNRDEAVEGKYECTRQYSGDNPGAHAHLVAPFGLRGRDATSTGIAL